MEIAHVRILRLAVGTALSMWVSQAAGWGMSFIAPVMTMFILALPLPAPKLKGGVLFVAALTLSMYAGMLLLPPLLNYPLVGLLLLILALFWSFYFTASGGSPRRRWRWWASAASAARRRWLWPAPASGVWC